MKISAIDLEDIERFLGEKQGVVKKNTVCQHIIVLRMILSAGVRWKMIKANPAKEKLNFGAWEDDDQEIAPLTPAEVDTFLKNTGEWRTFFLVSFCTGLRIGEMLAMKWGNLDGNTYSATENLRRDNSFGAPKTKSSKASVKISPAVVAACGRSGSTWPRRDFRRRNGKIWI